MKEKKVINFIQEKGVAIIGTDECGLELKNALIAVEIAMSNNIPILGGDVYISNSEGIRSAYANWHIDKKITENHSDYVQRSCSDTTNYIKKYPKSKSEAIILFVLVLDEVFDTLRLIQ